MTWKLGDLGCNPHKINSLLFADDLVLVSETKDGLQNCLDALHEYTDTWKLTVNIKKTNAMVFQKSNRAERPKFSIGSEDIKLTESYKYLGLYFNRNGSLKPAVKEL